METSSAIGPIVGGIAVIGTTIIKGLPLPTLLSGSAAMIVFGGVLGALLVGYPLKDFIFSFKSLGLFLHGPVLDFEGTIMTVERLAQLARKDGVLALEKEIEKLDDDLMQKGVEMVSMNVEPSVIENTLYAEIEMRFEEDEVAAKFWEDGGAFAPTVGIMGAVLGLMVVMNNLDAPEKIGPGIRTAFVATLYGVGAANLFFLPAGKKIKRMSQQKKIYRELIATGVLGIAQGTAPKAIVERLQSMVIE